MGETQHLKAVIPIAFAGGRLDRALARIFTDYSRTVMKTWILDGKLLLNQRRVRPRETVAGGEQVDLWIDLEPEPEWKPEAIALEILHEDADLIIIDKPPGLVVHPGAGNRERTLLNALLNHDPDLAALPRAGIVHRLDKDTSGILVVARSRRAHTHLIKQLQTRSLERQYQAVVKGVMIAGGSVDVPIGRHPTQRTRMAVVAGGKEAVTHYRVIRRFRAHTHVEVKLHTGRTHQIRVHMAHLHYPLVGDPVYGGRLAIPAGTSPPLAEALRALKRQALHAARVGLMHPFTGRTMEWTAPIPEDMKDLLRRLAEDGDSTSPSSRARTVGRASSPNRTGGGEGDQKF